MTLTFELEGPYLPPFIHWEEFSYCIGEESDVASCVPNNGFCQLLINLQREDIHFDNAGQSSSYRRSHLSKPPSQLEKSLCVPISHFCNIVQIYDQLYLLPVSQVGQLLAVLEDFPFLTVCIELSQELLYFICKTGPQCSGKNLGRLPFSSS